MSGIFDLAAVATNVLTTLTEDFLAALHKKTLPITRDSIGSSAFYEEIRIKNYKVVNQWMNFQNELAVSIASEVWFCPITSRDGQYNAVLKWWANQMSFHCFVCVRKCAFEQFVFFVFRSRCTYVNLEITHGKHRKYRFPPS